MCPPAGYKNLHLGAGSTEASCSRSQTEPLRPSLAGGAQPASFWDLGTPISSTHSGFGQGRGDRSFLSPFTSRTPGNAERGARRRRTSARPAQRRPIPSAHANEVPYRAAAPPPAAGAVVTHSWGPRAAAARLRGARSHRLLSALGLSPSLYN